MKETNEMTVETVETQAPVSNAYLVKEDDAWYIVDNGVKSDALPITKDGICFKLPANSANRVWYNIKKAEKEIVEAGSEGIYLTYKASVKYGSQGAKLPNEKLIAYLDEADRAEYEAIIQRAREAMAADKAKPMTELEKAEAKAAKAKAAYEKLLAEAAKGNN